MAKNVPTFLPPNEMEEVRNRSGGRVRSGQEVRLEGQMRGSGLEVRSGQKQALVACRGGVPHIPAYMEKDHPRGKIRTHRNTA